MPRRKHALALALAASVGLGSLLAASPAKADDKYALGVFHFNIQYVAGGMVGYFSVPDPNLDLTAEQIEDNIVTESFEPVLELYQKHPTWGVDIELQGYFLDVLAARHQSTLDLLRTLAKSGQIDVLSFHYSDQLFVAHPYEDWSRSQARTAATFAKYDIPLGKSVFCQEGQSGEVMAKEMKARGYQTMIWPKNLFFFQHQDAASEPLYRFGDIQLVLGGQGLTASGIDVEWTYFDDGEIMATGGIDPYFADVFKKSDDAVAKYEAGVASLEQQGYQVTTVAKYAAAVGQKVTPADPPSLLDGTWQPNSTDSVHRWLGEGGLWFKDERDNDVRTLADVAHREIAAAEAIAAKAGLDATAEIDAAERLLSLGEVSDATGINPFRGEVEYGLAHMAEATRIARDVIRDAKEKLALGGESVAIDPSKGTAAKGEVTELRGKAIEPPMKLTLQADDRAITEAWEQISPSLTRVQLDFAAGDAASAMATFPGAMDDALVTTRALDDQSPATYSRSSFTFESMFLPLPMGLVGLGNGQFLIQDQAYVHLGAQIFREKGDVAFDDETQTVDEAVTWVFYVFTGSPEDAVAMARSINDQRAVSR